MHERSLATAAVCRRGLRLAPSASRLSDPAGGGLGGEIELIHHDLPLAPRRVSAIALVHDDPRAMREAGSGSKAATITPEGADDVGSDNRVRGPKWTVSPV